MRTDEEILNHIKQDEIEEGFYLLDEYGLVAFLDISDATSDHPKGIKKLNNMRLHYEELEEYEKCAHIRDMITLLN